ncbi:hypothetical protein A3D11_02130 [Candidatus Peribacteria bacterium RIFCSPHIGHO2_02_FULL_49_16]|nr:MAG: hypothetical protein A2880_02955 [Candidatus Peribacteria bacterium RIFCSPHIGHO2_01_FULL_49_38]OGJ60185.1 MAG: hypothetical protein A3D11_02130 [Candidatus Peribacteria bacterium RIFCSPHIGHO2_02_FULL_49_16]
MVFRFFNFLRTEKRRPSESGNCYGVFQANFPVDRSKVFLELENGEQYSFNDLERISGRFMHLLENLGIQSGDRIVVDVGKSAEALFFYIACLRFGVVYVPIRPQMPVAEVEYILKDIAPALVVCQPADEVKFSKLTQALEIKHMRTLGLRSDGSLMEESVFLPPRSDTIPVPPDSVACILYTSGTTGQQKGVMLTYKNLIANAEALQQIFPFRSNEILLHTLSLYHLTGLLTSINHALYAGIKIILLARVTPDTIAKFLPRATIFIAAPATYASLLELSDANDSSWQSVRFAFCATAPLHRDLADRFRKHTGRTIVDRYGMSEAMTMAANSIGERSGSVGKAVPSVNIRITDEYGRKLKPGEVGNIEIEGPQVFKGYWNDEQKTKESFRADGFFITGDLGKLDSDGYLSLSGRAKDVIVTASGGNIYPQEVERHLNAIEGIEDSVVFGVPHLTLGEYPIALLKKNDHASGLDAKLIISKLKQSISAYKLPKKFLFVDEIPKSQAGKISRKLLSERYKNL